MMASWRMRLGFVHLGSQEVLDEDFASYAHEHHSADDGHHLSEEQPYLPTEDNAHKSEKERHVSDNRNGGEDVYLDESKTDSHNKGIDAGGQCHAAEHAPSLSACRRRRVRCTMPLEIASVKESMHKLTAKIAISGIDIAAE